MPKILIAGGGSGGHVAPAIAIAEALGERSCDVLIAHSTRAIDVKMIVNTPFASTTLPAKPLSLLPHMFLAFCIGFVRSVSETKKKYVAAQQSWKCNNCANQLNHTFEVDHKVDLRYGGTNHVSNLVALCRNCHGEKTMQNKLE